jgi:aspartyl-tRNA(Asn)/glutamyl-tRNA(Gln) amidotransferase subunit A
MSLAWSLDKIGPVARSAEDCGLVLEAIAGGDPRDPGGIDRPFRFAREGRPLTGRRIAVHRPEFDAPDAASNRAAFDEALAVFRRLGATLEDVVLPVRPYLEVFMHVTSVESAATFRNLFESGRVDGVFEYNWSRRADWLAASMAPAHDYLKAQRIRQQIVTEGDALLARYDLAICPTFPGGAPDRYAPTSPRVPPPPPTVPLPQLPRLNWVANLSGLPGMSIPCGFDGDGLPLALHLVGRAWDEQGVLDAAMAFQRETGWHQRRPPYPWRG